MNRVTLFNSEYHCKDKAGFLLEMKCKAIKNDGVRWQNLTPVRSAIENIALFTIGKIKEKLREIVEKSERRIYESRVFFQF